MNSKSYTHKLLMYTSNNEGVKEMHISKFKVAQVVIILSTIIGIGSVIAQLEFSLRIPSSGSIGPIPPGPGAAYESEIRAVFVQAASFINPDWELIAQTCKDYDVNTLVIEIGGASYMRYPTDLVPSFDTDELGDAIAAAHARGMELHISMDVLLSPNPDELQWDPIRVVNSAGQTYNWVCPTKSATRSLVKSLVEEIATNYNIDGFMFDYVRYETADMCYCPECRAKFEEWLGEGPITDWTLFYPTGSRYNEFMEWRTYPINDLVRDMRSWMLAIKPNLEFSAAVWGWVPGVPTYNRYWIGQDSAHWVKEGYLDWTAPMQYTSNIGVIQDYFSAMVQEMVAGPEGKIPLVAFLSTDYPSYPDPANFKQQVDTIRAVGADGWIIWRYGGPGDYSSGSADITPHLAALDLPPVFSLNNINASSTLNACAVTWNTDLPATSKVEFATSPLFTESFVYDPGVDFSYWDVDHVAGTIVEDATPVIDHSITLTGLQEGKIYYYRVQSQDVSGIASSKVYTFQL